jgi:hypothetical protein
MGTKEKINFESFSYYTNQNPGNGYGGMNWISVYTLGQGLLNQLGYCDTGYNNAIHGKVDAFTSPFSDGYGIFESANFADHFKLNSMVVASAWCGTQNFTFNTYSYRNGALHLKAADTIAIVQGSQTINFANYGKDFVNIAAVNVLTAGLGSIGSSCTYGAGTYGYQMAFDNMKVVFNNGIPVHQNGHHALLPIQMLQHHHSGSAAGHLTNTGAGHSAFGNGDSHATHHTSNGYHSQLMSLGHESGMTSHFHLPSVEHFGS